MTHTEAVPVVQEQTKELLVRGCRVLAHQRIADNSGHLSVRLPGTNFFLIHQRMAPGLATVDSLLVLDDQGAVVAGSGTKPQEWPIHAAIYVQRPDVQSVMHSHSRMSRIFSVSKVPLRTLNGLALNAFGAGPVPVYRGCGPITDREDGDTMAGVLGGGAAVLLRAHGNVVAGGSIEETVVLSVMLEGMADTLHAVLSQGEADYLTDEEVDLWRARTGSGLQKAWEYYLREAGV